MSSPEKNLNRAVTWRRSLDRPSFEQAQFISTSAGVHIAGTVLAAQEGMPLRVDYRIECDQRWKTGRVCVEHCLGGIRKRLLVEREDDESWLRDGRVDQGLAGCSDVDLGISPSTNTLPIRRLAMGVGGANELQAAWIRFPDLTVSRVRQCYRRVSELEYQYQNLNSGFSSSIIVDADGLVQEYGKVWTRVAEGVPAPDASSFVEALISRGPSPELGDAAEALGWLVGGWSAEVTDFDTGGQVRTGAGEWWFSWVLEGRALQDVWIVPPRNQRSSTVSVRNHPVAVNNRYGTTVRWFDRSSGQLSIVWVNPVSGVINLLAGTRQGNRIVLQGEEEGHAIRWSFNDIQPESFVWRGESRAADGSWKLDTEFRLKRIADGGRLGILKTSVT